MRTAWLISIVLLAACEAPPDAPGALDAGAGADGGAFEADAGPGSVDAATAAVDAGSDAVDAGSEPPVTGGTCPPEGPFGTAVGDVAPDLVLMDCDGVEHTLHELCEDDAVWLFEYADWCPPCRDFASRDANRVYDRFRDQGLGAYLVISEDSGFGEPDAADCAAIQERYGIHMQVLYDPGTAFEDTFAVASNEVQIVLRRGGVIAWKGHYQGDEVEGQIESVLAP